MEKEQLVEIYERAKLIYKRTSSPQIKYMAKFIAEKCEQEVGSLGSPPAEVWK